MLTRDEQRKAQRAQSRIDHFGHDKVAGAAVEFAATISGLRETLGAVEERCREYIADCCGDDEHRFCSNYGCSTLRGFLRTLHPKEKSDEGSQ